MHNEGERSRSDIEKEVVIIMGGGSILWLGFESGLGTCRLISYACQTPIILILARGEGGIEEAHTWMSTSSLSSDIKSLQRRDKESKKERERSVELPSHHPSNIQVEWLVPHGLSVLVGGGAISLVAREVNSAVGHLWLPITPQIPSCNN